MADVEKILRLVSEGVLTPQEADEILGATDAEQTAAKSAEPSDASASGGARQLRIEVTEGGRRVVNLRVPVNIAGWASAFLPGLSEDETHRIRSAIDSGVRGPILDIGDDDGSRVLITSE